MTIPPDETAPSRLPNPQNTYVIDRSCPYCGGGVGLTSGGPNLKQFFLCLGGGAVVDEAPCDWVEEA